MATLNTQPGYRAPRTPGMPAPKPVYAPAAGLARALSGVGQSYANPYDTSGKTNDMMTGLAAGPISAPTYPTVPSAPSGTPQTYTPQAPQAPSAPPGYQFDLTTDPVLQQIMAAADRQRADANAGALAQQKQLAIQYGDANAGNAIDAATGQAAAGNTFGVYQNLANQYQTGQHNLDENLNAHNLFYSGERIHELAQALQDYQQQQANAAAAEQAGLGNINANKIAGLMGADQSVQQGYADAYSRALALALQFGYGALGPGGTAHAGDIGAPSQIAASGYNPYQDPNAIAAAPMTAAQLAQRLAPNPLNQGIKFVSPKAP